MKKNILRNKKVLLTCGPTWVALDSVRVISNQSSGELGKNIAEELKKSGAKVTVLQGPVYHALTQKDFRVVNFKFFNELETLLKNELKKKYDCAIHAAAVSDFQPRRSLNTKIKSEGRRGLTLKLIPTPKLINLIKKHQPKTFLVGFKLDVNLNARNIFPLTKKLFGEAKCDLIVANSVNVKKYQGFILNKNKIITKARSRAQMAQRLVRVINKSL